LGVVVVDGNETPGNGVAGVVKERGVCGRDAAVGGRGVLRPGSGAGLR